MRKILKVTSILGIATIIKIFSGVIRAKFLAWQLGPAGLGIIGQGLMYSIFTIQLCGLNMPMGITKGIAENLADGKKDKVPLVIDMARTFQLIAAAIFIAMVLPFSGQFTKFIFSDSRYWGYFIGITLVAPFAIYLVGLTDPVFYGFRKITEYTKLMVAYTLIGLFLMLALVYFFKIEGMLIEISLISVVGFLMGRYFIKKRLGIAPRLRPFFWRDKEARAISSQLFQYSLISFIPGNLTMAVMLYIRGHLIRQYGADANGFYQVAYGLSSYYLPFISNGLWGHLYPQLCSVKDPTVINSELNQFIRFTLFAATSIAAGLIILRDYVIMVLFSSEFMEASSLLVIQSVGDIFFMIFCAFGTMFMARRNFKAIVLVPTFLYNAMLVALYFLFTRSLGLGFKGLNLALAATNIGVAFVCVLYARSETGFLLARENAVLLAKSMIFLVLVYMIPGSGIASVTAKSAVFIAWALLSAKKSEIKSFKELVMSRIKPGGGAK